MTPVLIAVGRSMLLLRSIKHLADEGFRFSAIVTCPANPEHGASPEDFEHLAADIGSAFFCTRRVDDPELRETVAHSGAQLGISVNWPYIIPAPFLDALPLGLLNLHLGLLPDYKGNATVNWAILQGEDHIFADVHRMAPRLDSGDVIARHRIALTERTYVGDVLAGCEDVAPFLFAEAARRRLSDPGYSLVAGSANGLRCFPRLPEDGLIDWYEPAEQVARLVRASSRPYPGAYSFFDGRRVRIWRASVVQTEPFLAQPGHVMGWDESRGSLRVACGDHCIEIEELEVEGMAVRPADLTRSIRTRFGTAPGRHHRDPCFISLGAWPGSQPWRCLRVASE